MLRKLRVKFIALNMVLATLVVAVSFGVVCRLDYQAKYDEMQDVLRVTLENAAREEVERADVPEAGGAAGPPRIGKHADAAPPHIPVAVYRMLDDGSYELLGMHSTATIPDGSVDHATSVAKTQADNLAEGPGEAFGEVAGESLLYAVLSCKGGTLVAFADTSYLSSTDQLARTLVIIGAATLLAFLAINVFFSRWALRPVGRAWEQQRQFTADASHELKTPLTVIMANTAILRTHPDATVASQSQWVESTQAEAARMQGLVNDMLELARLDDTPAAERVARDVDLTDLAESFVLQFESVAFERGILLKSDLAPEVHVCGDAKRLERLVSTLVDNACKYAGEGGRVHVTLEQVGHEARLVVRNSGETIPPEDLPHVFDRFYRGDKARTRDASSYGLGLAIAQEVARDHGGAITVASSETEGTAFTVALPLAR
ncbi:cell wall metabolism sensor histidine kinase WalK [Adlercreutzia sp. ZJ242]|uniref:sensor histidine kinase n=1 Tax=Adlercreutzia sp. ZJ242 TaxID=2709409 RepID=UPI0013EA9C1F|nr:HAMP domain-containing sensor histidine kinase [Adlercreutzia sp. ZJ242]